MHSVGFQVLKAKIRGFYAEGLSISHRISKAKKERKTLLWESKRRLGTHCRYHLVAYGLLKGVPYHKIEKCAENNRLNPQDVLDIMLAHVEWSQRQRLNLKYVTEILLTTSLSQSSLEGLASPQAAHGKTA